MQFISVPLEDAKQLIDENQGTEYKIRFKRVKYGEYEGKFVLPLAVMQGEYAEYWSKYLDKYPIIGGNPDLMFDLDE